MDSKSATERLHIAIALAILHNKPPQQALSSYILDLKTRFPLVPSISCPTGDHQPEHSGFLSAIDNWRKRALALEEENETLKLRVQKQELEVLALKVPVVPSLLDDSTVDLKSLQALKKKREVNQTALKSRLDLRKLGKGLRSGPDLPALNDSLDVLTSFRKIQLDVTSAPSEIDPEAILIPNIKRSLTALGNLLAAIISQEGTIVASSSRVGLVSCLCNLLLSLLNSTLPLAPCHAILPHILSELAMHIIRPLIRGFYTLSIHAFTLGCKEIEQKAKAEDIRPDLMCILKRLLECLDTLKASTREIREFVIFEAAKEVETLWRIEGNAKSMKGEYNREHCIGKLARKDSLWYHCAVLQIALDRLPPSNDTGKQSLLASAAVSVLADLIHHFERQVPVDEVAMDMVLAVVEKAWLSCLYNAVDEEKI